MSKDDFHALVGTGVGRNNREVAQPSMMAGTPSEWAEIAASAACWERSGDAFFPVSEVQNKLPAGAYRCCASNRGLYFERMPVNIDNLLVLPDGTTAALLDEFKKFWTLESEFGERGFVFKRGMLLWGPPGSGKTSAIWQMTQAIAQDHDGVVVFIEDPQLAAACLAMLRRVEPTRPLITVSEDIDALVQRYGDHGYLALLDGEVQISRVVHVATTNYPELLDKRFVDRPSRFDTIMFVDMPSADARRVYFKAKEPGLDEVTLERWVRRSDGYSVAHLREVIVAIKCFGQSESVAFERLDKMRGEKIASDGEGGRRPDRKVGFGASGATA